MAGRVAFDTTFLIDMQRERTALTDAGVTRELRRRGELMGTSDLWIAATSLRHGLALVTADKADFARVDGLEVVGYR